MRRQILIVTLLSLAALLVACTGSPAAESETPIVADPDPGRLAFVHDGDIWVMSLPDGTPERVTGDGRNTDPRWSPTGAWLSYLKDTELWTVRVGEGDPRLLDSPVNQVAWSPIDDRLAYIVGSGRLRLVVAQPDGTDKMTPLPADNPEGQVSRISWSPDGAWIAYTWGWERETQGLWKVRPEGSEPVSLYQADLPDQGVALLAGWSSDGTDLLFWQGPLVSASMLADGVPLYAIAANTADEVANPRRLTEAMLLYDDFLISAPAGTSDRVAVVEGGGRGAWTQKTLKVIDPNTGQAVTLSPQSQAAVSPDWSPDGTRLAYSAMPDEGDLVGGDTAREGLMQRRISTVGADGEGLRQITDDAAYRDERPRWSAGGTRLLFVRLDAGGGASLWWIEVDGTEPKPKMLVDDLGPIPFPGDPDEAWFGYYGYTDWDRLFDRWQGAPGVRGTAPE